MKDIFLREEFVTDKELLEKYQRQFREKYVNAPADTAEKEMKSIETKEDKPSGGLIVSVTSLRGFYGVPDAEVTVFTGGIDEKNIIDSDVTDSSGRTKKFILDTESKTLSGSAGAIKKPYSEYNISVVANGYAEQINMDIPIFEGVTTVQQVGLTSKSADGGNSRIVVYEKPHFNL